MGRNRLTEVTDTGYVIRGFTAMTPEEQTDAILAVVDRLGEYEDTLLTPLEVLEQDYVSLSIVMAVERYLKKVYGIDIRLDDFGKKQGDICTNRQ